MTTLNALGLCNVPGVADKGLAHLAELSLSQLNLSGTQVTDAGLEHLQKMSSLRELLLDGTRVTDTGVNRLKGLKLTHLALSTTRVTDTALEHLKSMSTLFRLNVGGTRVTDEELGYLRGLQLRELGLNDTLITDTGLESLRTMKTLELLRLGGTGVSGTGLAHLKDLRKLNNLCLYGLGLKDADVAMLKGLPLCQLDLDRTQVTDAVLEHLQAIRTLQLVSLRQARLTGKALEKYQHARPNVSIVR